jgi:hypothetical protein
MATVKETAVASKAKPKAAPKPAAYEVLVNNGNEGGVAIASLDELAGLAERVLCSGKGAPRSVTLRVSAIVKPGGVRVDGVK